MYLKTVDDVIEDALMHAYDPQKAHEYYLRVRELKGRQPGHADPLKGRPTAHHPPPPTHSQISPALQAQINSIKSRLAQLQARLRELLANKQKTAKKSDHKTAAEKSKDARESKKYRDAHKSELAQKAKKAASKSGGGSKPSSISSMTETEVRAAISRAHSDLQAAVAKARQSTA